MTSSDRSAITDNKELSKAHLSFIVFCKKFGWGKLEVTVKNGEPCMVSPIKQDFKMDD